VLVVPLDPTTFPKGPLSIRASARFTPDATGPHFLTLVQTGPSRVLLDGRLVLDGVTNPPRRGREFFGMGSEELRATVPLAAGVGHDLVVEYTSEARAWVHGAQLGCLAVPPTDLLDRAVAAAERADAVVVVVGTNDNWESEGYDRDDLDLPGEQATLIERVTAVNPRTAVVLNAGSPVSTSWAATTPAVLQAWFGGQEMAGALCDVLFGDADPGGRLPTTFPVRMEDTPSFGNYPGEHGQVRYGEGLLVGYRWYDARRIAPAFPFGHGLSYTRFAWSSPRPSATAFAAGDDLTVEVDVTNTGERAGWEVVQCYVAPLAPRTARPPKELKAFAKVHLAPGATETVRLHLDDRSFACWDPGGSYRSADRASPSGFMVRVEDDSASGWRIDPGVYELHLARSATDVVMVATVTIEQAHTSESA
jgi:beta-glucosidase